MFDDFADDILKTEVKQRKPKSGFLKRCRGQVVITGIKEVSKDSELGKKIGPTVIFDMQVLTVTPADPALPNDVNVVGEPVSKWFKFEDGNVKKRSIIKADFKRQLCSVFGVNPETLTAEQYKAMAKAVAEGKATGIVLNYEPRVTEKGMVFHDFYQAPGKNSMEAVQKRATLLANGAKPEELL